MLLLCLQEILTCSSFLESYPSYSCFSKPAKCVTASIIYVRNLLLIKCMLSNAVVPFFPLFFFVVVFFPLSPSRVYLVAQERQDEVSNWLCVQVMLIQLQALQRHPGKMNESRNHMKKKRKCLSSQKNNNCCTIIQTSYNFTTWFGMMFHVKFIHLLSSSVSFSFD